MTREENVPWQGSFSRLGLEAEAGSGCSVLIFSFPHPLLRWYPVTIMTADLDTADSTKRLAGSAVAHQALWSLCMCGPTV